MSTGSTPISIYMDATFHKFQLTLAGCSLDCIGDFRPPTTSDKGRFGVNGILPINKWTEAEVTINNTAKNVWMGPEPSTTTYDLEQPIVFHESSCDKITVSTGIGHNEYGDSVFLWSMPADLKSQGESKKGTGFLVSSWITRNVDGTLGDSIDLDIRGHPAIFLDQNGPRPITLAAKSKFQSYKGVDGPYSPWYALLDLSRNCGVVITRNGDLERHEYLRCENFFNGNASEVMKRDMPRRDVT